QLHAQQPQWTLDSLLNIGTNASGIAITPDNSKIVVTNNGNPGLVKIISTSNYSITTVDISSIENFPNMVAIAPNGTVAYVNTLHRVIAINLLNGAVVGTFTPPCAGTSLVGL